MAKIEIVRGNSAEIPFTVKNGEVAYTLAEGEQCIFTVKARREKKAAVVLQKILTADDYDANSNLILTLDPADTIDLLTGETGQIYFWDFGIKLTGNKFYTPLVADEFKLLPALGTIEDGEDA